MQLQLGPTGVGLQDGLGTWNASAANALALWNQHLQQTQFSWVNNATVAKGAHNGRNNVSFAQTVYGDAFGGDTLAVTVWWTSSNSILTEADVLFNNLFSLQFLLRAIAKQRSRLPQVSARVRPCHWARPSR